MAEEKRLQGWVPELGGELTLAQVIEFAFDYRGNVTVVKTDGSEVAGYLFNRNAELPEPFVQMFDDRGNGPFAIQYADIRNIKFTGRDTAAGKSYEAWVKRREKERARQQRGAGEAPVSPS